MSETWLITGATSGFGRLVADRALARGAHVIAVGRRGTVGALNWWSRPSSSAWNDTSIEKIAWPCWIAVTRRVVKLLPSRRRSTS